MVKKLDINWQEIFDSIHYGELVGASNEQIVKFVQDCVSELNSGVEVAFPEQYLSFLQFCNSGVTTMTGERELQFFTTENLVQYNLDYQLNTYMKGAISIAMDGCGHHIVFDCRKCIDGKLYGVDSGSLGWSEAKLLANNFLELCMGTESIDEVIWAES